MADVQDVVPHTIGERIAQSRREFGVRTRQDVTPSDLAVMLGVAPATVYRWENNEKHPSRENLVILAARLGVTPAYLVWGQLPKHTTEPPESDRYLADDFDQWFKREAKKKATPKGGRTRAG